MSERVVVSLPDRANEFQALQAKQALEVGARLGFEVQIEYGEGSALEQIQQLFKHVHGGERPLALVVEPMVVEGMKRVAQKAAASGIGWSILNCTADFVAPLRAEHPQVPVFAVGSDQVEIGRMQGRQVRVLLPSGGSVLYVQGPPASVAAQERLQGFEEELAATEIRSTVLDAQWTEESAEDAVASWLRLKTNVQMDVVACQDDSMARGARRAVEAVGGDAWNEASFLGIDGVPTVGQKMVADGLLTATVVQPSNTGPALEALASWRQSGAMPPPFVRLATRSYPPENELRPRSG